MKHDIDKAFTANMINPRRYMVMWSETMGCFIRWTWFYPTRNEVIAA